MNRPASLVAVAAVALGCSPHKVTHNPKPPVAAPAQYSKTSAAPKPEKWWRDFGDEQLNALIERALADNFQLEAAWARLQQARAAARGASGSRWPTLDASFSAQRQKFRSPFADADSTGMLPETFEIDQFNGSLAAGYEVDVWRKLGNQASAANLDALAARDAAEALAMTLVAQVAEAWFDLTFQTAQRALLVEQVEINETFLELTELRFKQGLASALDIYQQQQLVIARRAQLTAVDGAAAVARNRLAVLLGKAPGSFDVGQRAELPTLPAVPGLGIPADLLTRRPDVRAAGRSVEAADSRVAVAVANRLPGLRLQASLRVQNGDITKLFDNILWTILGSVAAPLFRGGQLKAEVERNEAVVREKLADYGNALITAIGEVENALVQEQQQLVQIEQLKQEGEIAGNALREARTRYREGLSDFLPVLTALQSQQNAQLKLLQAQRQSLSFRVQLLRALGGTWTGALSAEPKQAGQKKEAS